MLLNMPSGQTRVDHTMEGVTAYGPFYTVSQDIAMEWSNEKVPPRLGAKVKVTMNSMGPGQVTGYFVEYGWLGVYVKLGLRTRPAYQKRQNPENEPVMVFGVEIEY